MVNPVLADFFNTFTQQMSDYKDIVDQIGNSDSIYGQFTQQMENFQNLQEQLNNSDSTYSQFAQQVKTSKTSKNN